MTEQEAFKAAEKHCTEELDGDCCEIAAHMWSAALAWLRSQGEPAATLYDDNDVPKSCPFCGGAAEFDHDDDGWTWIECIACGASTNARTSAMDDCKPLLLEQWNKRASLAPQPAIPDGWLDRGKAALAECRAADDLWSDDRLLSHLFNAMTATTQPVMPDGWKLVPMEPTPTMLSAGAEGSGEFIEHAHFVWTQMLAAAPEPSK